MKGRAFASDRRPRGGWQLIELSMVLAVLGMISVAATRTILALMSIENRSGQALQDAETLQRLGQQWRSDLHRATSTRLAEDGLSLEIRHSDAPVTYRIVNNRLSREKPLVGGKGSSRETYSAAARSWRFEICDEGQIVAVIRESAPLTLMGAAVAASPSQVDQIEAAVGTLFPARVAGQGVAR